MSPFYEQTVNVGLLKTFFIDSAIPTFDGEAVFWTL
jgi:hypothetical protein